MNCLRTFLSILLCIVCYVRVLAGAVQSNRSLALLQIVYRHGDRTPISTYRNDPHPLSVWKEGPGQLTNKGCMQHYTLGRHLRERYSDFITGNPHEIHVRSSDKDRCLASASCHLAGMYPPSGRWVWDKDFPWQPIAIHTRPVEEDPVLVPGEQHCPEETKEDERFRNSPEGQSFLAKYHKLYVYLTEKSGSVINDWTTSERLFNVLMIEKLYNFTLPNWTEGVWSNLSYQYDQSFVFFAKTPLLQRLRGGPLLGKITKNLEAASKKNAGGYKIHMYSAHDTTVASLREALGVFDNKAPEYCSTVLFELWEEADGTHSVEVYALDAFHPDPEQLSVPGCGNKSCSLSTFLAVAREKVPEDWARECGLGTKPFAFSTTELEIVGGATGILLLLLFVILLCCACKQRANKKGSVLYSRLPEEPSVN